MKKNIIHIKGLKFDKLVFGNYLKLVFCLLDIKKVLLFPLLFSLLFLPHLSFPQTITVKQDGTGDFTTIQAAVDSAQNGDTVLVWPGIYYENVDFNGKSITLGSLTLTTGNTDYKYSTIIDGNYTGSCIAIIHNETDVVINGFTLQHGKGTHLTPYLTDFRGGGLAVYDSHASVYNCVIKNNRAATFAGGIACEGNYNPTLFLSGVSIHDNRAYEAGGLSIYGNSVTFDSINRCSIYNNYAGYGNDIYTVNPNDDSIHFYLDTFTVSIPARYFFVHIKVNGIQTYNYTFDCQHAYLNSVNSDLYVNPFTGSDTNSGTSPDSALKTISWAYSKIKVDSSKINTIHLADGVYSESLSGERYPLNVRPFIYLVGRSRENTILDAEHKTKVAMAMHYTSNYGFKNLTLFRGGYKDGGYNIQADAMLIYESNQNVILDSIVCDSSWSNRGAINIIRSSVHISNSVFKNTLGGKGLSTGGEYLQPDTAFITNCIFSNNLPDSANPPYIGGGGYECAGSDFVSVLTGCLFLNNANKEISSLVMGYHPISIYMTNCTFTGCKGPDFYDFFISDGNVNMNNCIFYNESGSGILDLQYYIDTITFKVKNSLIEGGLQTLHLQGNVGLVWEENLDTDPLFYGGEEFPYNLSAASPCIDAGTLDLPQFILDHMPETDLAGNPRIFNGKIDMGAYEWNPTVDIKEIPNTKKQIPTLTAAPNPFTTQTLISAKWDTPARVNILIYNSKGLLVKTLQSGHQTAGGCQLIWDGTNQAGTSLPAGTYIVILTVNGKETGSVKVVKR